MFCDHETSFSQNSWMHAVKML